MKLTDYEPGVLPGGDYFEVMGGRWRQSFTTPNRTVIAKGFDG